MLSGKKILQSSRRPRFHLHLKCLKFYQAHRDPRDTDEYQRLPPSESACSFRLQIRHFLEHFVRSDSEISNKNLFKSFSICILFCLPIQPEVEMSIWWRKIGTVNVIILHLPLKPIKYICNKPHKVVGRRGAKSVERVAWL